MLLCTSVLRKVCVTSMENLVEWSKSFFFLWFDTPHCIVLTQTKIVSNFRLKIWVLQVAYKWQVFSEVNLYHEAASKLFKNVKYLLRFVWISVNHIHWFNDKGLVFNDVYPIPKFQVPMSNVQIIGLVKLWSDRITSIIVTCTISNLCNIGWLHFSCTCFSKAK